MIMGKARRSIRIAALAACALAIACLFVPAALADSAGNTITSGQATTTADLGSIGSNLYWAGRTLDLKGAIIGGDVIAAGQELDVDSASVSGNIRTASEMAYFTNTSVSGDITSAGRDLKVGTGTTCAGAYLAGATVEFAGTAKALCAGAQNVTISGVIDGDVTVDAEHVLVVDGAVITGTLTVHSSNQPQVASGAKVGNLDFHQEESKSTIKPVLPLFSMGALVYFAIVFAIIGIIAAWAFRRAVDGAGQMVRTRPAQMLVTGLIAIIAALPIIFILLLVAPLAGSLICAYGMIFFVAAPFAGTSVARLVFPQWNRFGAAAAGGAIAGVLVAIPIVQALFVFAAFMYLLGYALQCLYLDMKGGSEDKAPEGALPANGTAASTEERPSVPAPPASEAN